MQKFYQVAIAILGKMFYFLLAFIIAVFLGLEAYIRANGGR